jgi:hypothetical protein
LRVPKPGGDEPRFISKEKAEGVRAGDSANHTCSCSSCPSPKTVITGLKGCAESYRLPLQLALRQRIPQHAVPRGEKSLPRCGPDVHLRTGTSAPATERAGAVRWLEGFGELVLC